MKDQWTLANTAIATLLWVFFLFPCWIVANIVFISSEKWSFVAALASSLFISVFVTVKGTVKGAANVAQNDSLCGPCRDAFVAASDKVTDPVEAVLSAHQHVCGLSSMDSTMKASQSTC